MLFVPLQQDLIQFFVELFYLFDVAEQQSFLGLAQDFQFLYWPFDSLNVLDKFLDVNPFQVDKLENGVFPVFEFLFCFEGSFFEDGEEAEPFTEEEESFVFGVELGFVLSEDESVFIDFGVESFNGVDVLEVLFGFLDSIFDLYLFDGGQIEQLVDFIGLHVRCMLWIMVGVLVGWLGVGLDCRQKFLFKDLRLVSVVLGDLQPLLEVLRYQEQGQSQQFQLQHHFPLITALYVPLQLVARY